MNRQSTPFFSVVIPVHNKAPHVHRSIASVLKQTFGDFELLIIDDASTDNSVEEINRFDDPRIRVLRRETPGPGGYAARNLGISQTRAEWVALLDADDEWYPEHLEHMHREIEERPDAGMISAGWIAVNGDQERVQPYYSRSQSVGSHEINLHQYLRISLSKQRFCNSSVVVLNRNAVAEPALFPEGRARKGGDLYTWVKIVSRTKTVWSQHIAARVYRDSVNMVTLSEQFNPQLLTDMVSEHEHVIDSRDAKLLKRYANKLLTKDYIGGIRKTGSKPFGLLQYVFCVNYFDYSRMVLLSLVPPGILYSVYALYKAVSK